MGGEEIANSHVLFGYAGIAAIWYIKVESGVTTWDNNFPLGGTAKSVDDYLTARITDQHASPQYHTYVEFLMAGYYCINGTWVYKQVGDTLNWGKDVDYYITWYDDLKVH